MKLDPGMHIGMHLVFFGKSGVTLTCYVEKEILRKLTNEEVVHRFMNMEGKGRKYDL
jgi:hypothetical protein